MKIVELKKPPVIAFDYRSIGGVVVPFPVDPSMPYRDGENLGQLITVHDEEYERIKEHVVRIIDECPDDEAPRGLVH